MNNYENTVREMIRHENDLMNHRISWLLTLEGLLLAALGFAWDKTDARNLIYVFCIIGGVVSASSWRVLGGADKAIIRLYIWWDANKSQGYAGPGVAGFWRESWWDILLPWRVLPFLFIIAWLAVFIINYLR